MTDTPRLWDRRADETPKSYAAFLAYVALGARRSVREAAHQNHIKTISKPQHSGEFHGRHQRNLWSTCDSARDTALFPDISVVPTGSCVDVERAVTGLRESLNYHHVEAYGLIDRDDRTDDEQLARTFYDGSDFES